MFLGQVGRGIVEIKDVAALLQFPDKQVGTFFLPDLCELAKCTIKNSIISLAPVIDALTTSPGTGTHR